MVKRILATTALEETWGTGEPILFLGVWCQKYTRRDQWQHRDVETLGYHWDDREKLARDYDRLTKVYERFLPVLAARLNEIHDVSYSVKYWRILVGPWLGYFIHILFDRFESVRIALEEYRISASLVKINGDHLIPYDMLQFSKVSTDDLWNHEIFCHVLQYLAPVICQPIAILESQLERPIAGFNIRSRLGDLASKIASLFVRRKDAYLVTTYLPLVDEILIQLKLGQFPQIGRRIVPPHVDADLTARKWGLADIGASKFETLLLRLIPLQLPTLYLEGYKQLTEKVGKQNKPDFPNFIWTSNSHFTDDVFKAWTAKKIEEGVPLIIGQHGGAYGMSAFSYIEDHEKKISDLYLSWGWTDGSFKSIIPVGQLKRRRSLGVDHAKNELGLLITTTVSRYGSWIYSATIAGQWVNYFEEQCIFIEALPLTIREKFVVRLFRNDYGWDQIERWRDRLPDQIFDYGIEDINQRLKKSKLVVATYNATSYLESFTINIPTVMYWNEKHWELRDSALPHFEDLKEVGIFHESPESAANHVARIWDDVDGWWQSEEVIRVVTQFRHHYCAVATLSKLSSVLKKVNNDN